VLYILIADKLLRCVGDCYLENLIAQLSWEVKEAKGDDLVRVGIIRHEISACNPAE